jgi:uncharacterized protein YfdQ (DUF2303 family)
MILCFDFKIPLIPENSSGQCNQHVVMVPEALRSKIKLNAKTQRNRGFSDFSGVLALKKIH